MRESFVVNAEVRTEQGKSASRRLRRTGRVLGIIYGGSEAAVPFTVAQNELTKHLKSEAFYSHILTVQMGGKTEQAVLKDLQRHPVRDIILHMDLLRVSANQTIRMQVPIHFLGGDVAPGVKVGGGVVDTRITQVEVECLPSNLPEFIEVDLSQMNLNDVIHLSQLGLPEDVVPVELKHGTDSPVVMIVIPKAAEEEAPGPVAAADPAPAKAGGKAAPAKAPEKKK